MDLREIQTWLEVESQMASWPIIDLHITILVLIRTHLLQEETWVTHFHMEEMLED